MALQFGKRDNETTRTGLRPAAPAPSAAPRSVLGSAPGGTTPAAPLPTSGASATAPASGDATLTVGANIKLKGVEITDCDTLVVEGSVEATMNSRVIVIAEEGTFKGSAEVDVAEIRGRFDGELTVREKLTVFATGDVSGKTQYGRIVIEEGGQLSGEVSHSGSKSALGKLGAKKI